MWGRQAVFSLIYITAAPRLPLYRETNGFHGFCSAAGLFYFAPPSAAFRIEAQYQFPSAFRRTSS